MVSHVFSVHCLPVISGKQTGELTSFSNAHTLVSISDLVPLFFSLRKQGLQEPAANPPVPGAGHRGALLKE